jgi:hypothetical protein
MGRNFSITLGLTVACTPMRRPAITAAAIALAAHSIGCGGDDGAASPADAVRSYNGAVADGDGDRACKYLAASAQHELTSATQGQARGSCKQVIEILSAFYDDATKEKLRHAKVASAQTGSTARARFSAPTGLGGPSRAQTYELRKQGDDWEITSLNLGANESGTGVP